MLVAQAQLLVVQDRRANRILYYVFFAECCVVLPIHVQPLVVLCEMWSTVSSHT